MSKITDEKYGENNGIKYRIVGMGWYGDIIIFITPITDGIWYILIDFGSVRIEGISEGNGDAGKTIYNSSLGFAAIEKDSVLIDITFAFPEEGRFLGETGKRTWEGTFYGKTALENALPGTWDEKRMTKLGQ